MRTLTYLLVLLLLITTSCIAQQNQDDYSSKITIIMTKEINEARKAAIKSYFVKIDQGVFDETYFNLFSEDVELYFPKFGFTKGKKGLKKFGEQLGSHLNRIWHDIDNFNYIVTDHIIVVEGKEGGITKNGIQWPDNNISHGKFCNVFEFEGEKIKRIHIYVDPDLTSEDTKYIKIFKPQATAIQDTIPGIEILVEFTLKPGTFHDFEAVLLPHLEQVAAEETCLIMMANKDPKDQTRYMLYEKWKDEKEFLEVQMKRSYRASYEEKIQPMEAAARKVTLWQTTLERRKK